MSETPEEVVQPAMEGEVSKDAKLWGMLCHIGQLSGFVIPLGSILAPLIIWLMKKEEFEFVDHHGKEALNFQISLFIYSIVSGILCLVLIGFLLLLALAIAWLVLAIIAGIKANDGVRYRYPLILRLIK